MNTDYHEDEKTKKIEKKALKMPSRVFLLAAVIAMGSALCIACKNKKHTAFFMGEWVAPILLFGIYNKLVKQNNVCDC